MMAKNRMSYRPAEYEEIVDLPHVRELARLSYNNIPRLCQSLYNNDRFDACSSDSGGQSAPRPIKQLTHCSPFGFDRIDDRIRNRIFMYEITLFGEFDFCSFTSCRHSSSFLPFNFRICC
jgi:hypothetical protein